MTTDFEQYVHTLIPRDAQFAPDPRQVTRFLDSLTTLRAVPRDARLTVMKPSRRVRWYTDPLTGEKKSFPAYDPASLQATSDVHAVINPLREYSVALDGQGPPETAPFPLYADGGLFTKNYGFVIRLCLRPEPVLMSDPHGDSCVEPDRNAIFHHPVSGKVIEVAGVGYARFWVEFEFGKWLLPRINESSEILNSAIVMAAKESFGVAVVQGFFLL